MKIRYGRNDLVFHKRSERLFFCSRQVSGAQSTPEHKKGGRQNDRCSVLQIDPIGSGLFAYIVTFLVAWVFYAVTLHLATLYVVGETPHQRAALAGAAPALVSLLIQPFSPLVAVPLALLSDAAAIHVVYRLHKRGTALLALAHYVIAVVIGFALFNIITQLSA